MILGHGHGSTLCKYSTSPGINESRDSVNVDSFNVMMNYWIQKSAYFLKLIYKKHCFWEVNNKVQNNIGIYSVVYLLVFYSLFTDSCK